MLRVEFHCHTIYSTDSLSRPEDLIATCRWKGIDRLVITDHETIEGALIARELAPDMVIVGEEIRTEEGEFLAAFVTEEVPRGLPVREAFERLVDQGAFISISHPFDKWRNGDWRPETLADLAPRLDAIEIFNARCMRSEFNRVATEYAQTHGLKGTVGSDAHSLREVGRATMLLPDFEDAAGLREALVEVQYDTTLSSPLIHFTSRYAVWRKSMQKR